MRILEINKFYNAKRGADKQFLDVIDLLEKDGHQVAAFSMWQTDNKPSIWSKYFLSSVGYGDAFSFWQKIGGVFRMFYSLEAKRKINAIMDDFKPEIVHIHNIYHQMSPAILFEIKKRNIPIVMTVHDFKIINPNHSLRLNGKAYERCANKKYYQCFLDKAIKNSYAKSFLASAEMYWHGWLGTYEKNIDLYIAPSQFTKSILIKWGIEEGKIFVLPHFISTSNNEDEKQNIYFATEKFAIYPGKISKEKGVDLLCDVFKDIKGMKLYLAGEIEEGFEIPTNANIRHLGFLNAAQLRRYLESAKCVVSGSQLPETFGLIALEALSNGKPFIGFNVGAYGEIIENSVDGAIVENQTEFISAIEEIAQDKKIFNQNDIKSHAEKYSETQYLKKMMNILTAQTDKEKYQQILKDPSGVDTSVEICYDIKS